MRFKVWEFYSICIIQRIRHRSAKRSWKLYNYLNHTTEAILLRTWTRSRFYIKCNFKILFNRKIINLVFKKKASLVRKLKLIRSLVEFGSIEFNNILLNPDALNPAFVIEKTSNFSSKDQEVKTYFFLMTTSWIIFTL